MMQNTWKMTETLAHGYSSESTLRELSMQWIALWQGLDDFQKSLPPCVLDESSLSIRRLRNCTVSLFRLDIANTRCRLLKFIQKGFPVVYFCFFSYWIWYSCFYIVFRNSRIIIWWIKVIDILKFMIDCYNARNYFFGPLV